MALQPKYARGDEGIEALRTGQNLQQDHTGIVPRFFIHRVLRKDGSVHEFECVELRVPGDLKTVSKRKVTDKERQMFPRIYDAWKDGEGAEIEGTRLDLWLGRDHPALDDLRYYKLITVEQLSEISDTVIQSLGMGYRELRDKALQFLASENSNEAIAAQNKELMKEIASMREQIARLAPTVVPEPTPETESGYTVERGFGGKYVVKDSDGTEVFSATSKGAKAECENWAKAN